MPVTGLKAVTAESRKIDDGWDLGRAAGKMKTHVQVEHPKRIIPRAISHQTFRF